MALRTAIAAKPIKRPTLPALRTASPVNPTGTPGAGASVGASAPVGSSGGLPSWQDDPILAQIKAAAQQSNASAQQSYDDARRRALLNYGYDPAMASLYDPQTAAAAQQNTYSTLAQLLHQNELSNQNIDTGENKSNLFYSTHRGQLLGEQARNYGQAQYNAGQALQGNLTSLAQALLGAQQGNAGNVLSGEQTAWQNSLNNALQYGLNTSPQAGSVAPLRTAVAAPRNLSSIRNSLIARRKR